MQRLTVKELAKLFLYDLIALGRITYEGKALWVYDLGGDGMLAVDEDLDTILLGDDLIGYDFVSADEIEDEDVEE